MAPYSLIWKDVIHALNAQLSLFTHFLRDTFSLAATLKILSLKKGVNNIFLDESGFAGPLETVIVLYKLYGANFFFSFSFFFHLKSSLQLLQLF